MKPADCKNQVDLKLLEEQGIAFNENSIFVRPNSVFLKIGPCKLTISQNLFRRFAEWYLRDQGK